jgi:hypothetical protein
MTVQENATTSSSTSSAQSFNATDSYTIVYASSSTYKVDITFAGDGVSEAITAYILKDGTVLAVDVEGQNITGSLAQEESVGLFAGFITQVEYDSQVNVYTASNYFHSTGTSTVTIGSNKVTVTNYVANTLPVTVDECGVDTNLTAYGLSVGTPAGASEPLVTSFHIAGSNSEGNYDVTLQVTSFTLAS